MTQRRTQRSVVVARVAVLLTCGQSLEGPRLHTISIDGARVRASTQDIESQWYWAFAAADVDLDGDDEVLPGVVGSEGAVTNAEADGCACEGPSAPNQWVRAAPRRRFTAIRT